MKACGCLAVSYVFLSALVLTLIVTGMINSITPVTFMNLTAFLWMPLVIFYCIFIVTLPITLIVLAIKILF